ncbi:hypothetical protein H0H93_011499 [Arthromyces matolae]|nr:hypothetical protein H0H93_011499 [Arthromyces matolae]
MSVGKGYFRPNPNPEPRQDPLTTPHPWPSTQCSNLNYKDLVLDDVLLQPPNCLLNYSISPLNPMFTDYWDWGLPEIAVVEDEQSSSLPPFTSVYRIVTKSPSSETIKPKAAKKKEAPIFQKPKSKPPTAPALPLTPDIKLPFDWASTSTAVDNMWRSSLPRASNLHEDCRDLIFSCDVKNICMEDLLDHVVYHQIKSKLQSSASWMGREDAKSGRHNCQQQSGATPVTPLLVRHIIVNTSSDEDEYQVFGDKRELHVFKNFKERTGNGMKGSGSWAIDAIHGGTLLGGRGAGFVVFWDWESGEIVRRIDVDAKNVFWSGTGSLVAIISDDSFYILRFDRDAYDAKVEEGSPLTDEGVEEAFEVIADVSESVKTAKWVGDCLVYTTANNRLCYFVGNDSYTISPFDTPLYLLGYMPGHNRVYLANKDMHVYGYSLSLSVVEYQTAVLRGDMDAAAEILPTLPKDQLNKVARFLESKDLKELALQLTTDPDHKFDLALQLDDLDAAHEIAREVPENEAELKWKALGDRALTVWRFDLAREAFEKANDLSALMLLLSATGDQAGLRSLAEKAEEKGQNNLAFATRFQLGDAGACVDLLVKTQRAPEAALFARTYAPSHTSKAVEAWKADLQSKKRPKLAAAIADPASNPELFEEGWEQVLAAENHVRHSSEDGVLVDATS